MNAAPHVLLDATQLAARGPHAHGPLAPLVASLRSDLEPALAAPLFIPPEKARLTRVGGRCPADGTQLSFDPFSPHRHRCDACGREYADDEHYRWWIMWYQLWLAERAVHAATLGALTADTRCLAFASDVLAVYVDRYLTYPNGDNVLGPSRPFFSTYLESIWLLQVSVALDLLESVDGRVPLGSRVRDRVIEPSRALIMRYDEGGSNRQVWNAAAVAAASRMLGDASRVEAAISGASGVVHHLTHGLLADGTWYEGENYHQFAHRGLWYGVAIARRAEIELPAPLLARFHEGFVAPFLTAFPDLTLPARRDSQWAISLRQWRYAEACELGLADRDDARLAGALRSLYTEGNTPRRDTGRARSAAESERNEPASALTRADLGWRSLLFARPMLPPADAWAPGSTLLPAQGIAVFRRDEGRRYVALDYGTSGGGHGHPDRLNVLFANGADRWFDDMGTGSYVERALHWYRSTLAHNAPLVDGRSQPRVDGELLAHDERGDWGWVSARAALAASLDAIRTIVVGPSYVVDRVSWTADDQVAFDLPYHADLDVDAGTEWSPATLVGAGGLEDGFDFVDDVESMCVPAGRVTHVRATHEHETHSLQGWIVADAPTIWFRMTAPGAPGRAPARFLLVRTNGHRGTQTSVWSTTADVRSIACAAAETIDVVHARGRDRHSVGGTSWTIDVADGARSPVVRLESTAQTAVARTAPVLDPAPDVADVIELAADGAAVVATLGEAHYRPSELDWADVGGPTATVRLAARDGRFFVHVAVATASPRFVAPSTANALDNERPEINGDGVQLYLAPAGAAPVPAWLLVPDERDATGVRILALTPAASLFPLQASATISTDGFTIDASCPLDALRPSRDPSADFGCDVIVNEIGPERERRRGQLVLSGRRGEFVYLQGDRHRVERFMRLRLAPHR